MRFAGFQAEDTAAVHALLAAAGLPTADLTPVLLQHFLLAHEDGKPVGVVGLERAGETALLRSLAVASAQRKHGLGRKLVAAVEQRARELGITALYLLTTDADAYFKRLGYAAVRRESAPMALRQTAQFASLCPSTSVLMRKQLNPAN